MKKKKGYIIYFDILGYKEILKHNNAEENERIANVLEQFSNYYVRANVKLGYGSKFEYDKLLVRSFSDNFLILYEIEKDDYLGFLVMQSIATKIQYQFLCVGVLTRGSITYGEIEYNENIVFGNDLIRAVELEKNHSEPSIIIDVNLKSVFDKNNIPFKNVVELFDVWPNSELNYTDCIDGLRKYLKQLNKYYVDNKILDKFKWVIDRVNDYFAREQKKEIRFICDYEYKLEVDGEQL